MRWRYAGATRSMLERVRTLLSLFHRLLLVLDGNVEEALERLEEIARRYGLFGDGFTMEDFREILKGLGEAIESEAGGTLVLTPLGERGVRQQAFDDVFSKLAEEGTGEHRIPSAGGSGEPADETRAYQFGDSPDRLDAGTTLMNWARRTGGEGEVEERDLEVRERERATACATVLLIDVSHSMTLYGEDRITPAKRVALALAELIITRYPKDTIDVVLFGDDAEVVPVERLLYVTNGPFHTNTKAGLVKAQEILRRHKGMNRQIVMLTDGKPSAVFEEGRLYKCSFGLDDRIVAATLAEAARCRRQGIQVTTFMLTADPLLRSFVERFTETCRGRAYFRDPAKLESFVLVDFLRNRRRRIRT